MVATESFTDAQAQFTETQKKMTDLWKESQQELMDSQKKLVDTWMKSFSGGSTPMSLPENFEKALSFQQELIGSSLKAQKVASNLAIETQKQFWDSYFQSTQKMAQQVKSN